MEYLYRDPCYNRINNPEMRSIGELAPIGLEWVDGETIRRQMFAYRGAACELRYRHGFAIVDIDLNSNGNAYIIDENGDIDDRIDSKFDMNSMEFHNVVYRNALTFVANHNNNNYFIIYDKK